MFSGGIEETSGMKWVKKNSGGGETAEHYSRPMTYFTF